MEIYVNHWYLLVALALFNTGLYFIAIKIGLIKWYTFYHRAWMPELCEFCLFFWMAFIELNVYNWHLLVINFITAIILSVISRKML